MCVILHVFLVWKVQLCAVNDWYLILCRHFAVDPYMDRYVSASVCRAVGGGRVGATMATELCVFCRCFWFERYSSVRWDFDLLALVVRPQGGLSVRRYCMSVGGGRVGAIKGGGVVRCFCACSWFGWYGVRWDWYFELSAFVVRPSV